MRLLPAILVVLGTVQAVPAQVAPPQTRWPVSLTTLLPAMLDLERLARISDPPYLMRRFSSYDRASRAPGDGWFANRDTGHFLGVLEKGGRKEHVLAAMEGPGALVRIWSADPKGTLRVYLDGAEAPVLEGRMEEILGGADERFPPGLAGRRGQGYSLWFPIPFAKQLRVTSDEGGFYYHVDVRKYGDDADVRGFTWKEYDDLEPEVRRIARAFDELRKFRGLGGPGLETTRVEAAPGARTPVSRRTLEEGGGEMITHLSFELAPPGGTKPPPRVLRDLILEMRFDGEATVAVPLGDFFGSAPGVTSFNSLPVGMIAPGLLHCSWIMPYAKSAEIALRNLGDESVAVTARVARMPCRVDERTLHFHAGFLQERDRPTRPFRDWTVLDVEGRGQFVGLALSVANPVKAWWGEGDEKIYVDGETFPSIFGTGTEDWFGYAWCSTRLFQHPYHGQTRCDGPGNRGFTSVHRWHVLDPIPFTERLRFDLELWHAAKDTTVSHAATVFWYARPGARVQHPPLTRDAVRLPEITPYRRHRVPGVLEAEGLRVLHVDGTVERQELGEAFSDEAHLWWRKAAPGGRLVLEVPAPKPGRYRVFVRFTRSWDYGIHQLTIGDAEAGAPVDLWAPEITAEKERDLGIHDASQGPLRLGLRVVGSNPAAKPRNHMAGIDYLRLVPAEERR